MRSPPRDMGKSLSSSENVTFEDDTLKKWKWTNDLPPIPESEEVNFDETSTNHDGQMVATDVVKCSTSIKIKRVCIPRNKKGSFSKKGKKATANRDPPPPPRRHGKGKYHPKNQCSLGWVCVFSKDRLVIDLTYTCCFLGDGQLMMNEDEKLHLENNWEG